MSGAGSSDRRAYRPLRLADVGVAVLVAGYPVTLTYFATATPYALVGCLSLALILVLLAVPTRRLAWGASAIILRALLFTRPNMLPIAMIPAGWALLIEPGGRSNASRSPSDVPGRLSCDVVDIRARPVGGRPRRARIVAACNLAGSGACANLKNPAANCFALDPVLSPREVQPILVCIFFRPYFAVSAIALAAIALRIFSAWREPAERRVKPIDLILAYS
jgi:hypothetical protein